MNRSKADKGLERACETSEPLRLLGGNTKYGRAWSLDLGYFPKVHVFQPMVIELIRVSKRCQGFRDMSLRGIMEPCYNLK